MNKIPDRSIAVFSSKPAMDGVVFEEWQAVCEEAVRRSGRFAAVLSGGRTPVSFYERLARAGQDLPWEKTHIFQADERLVPADHPASNMRMIERKLLRRVPIPKGNIHPVPVGLGPRPAALAYEKELRAFFGLRERERPRFDLVLLGLGEDGHTASLFPGDEALAETRRLAVVVTRPEPDHDRVSLTLPAINAAHVVIFMVAGENKAAALKAVLEGPEEAPPAARVRPRQGRSVFLADKGAARLLASPPRLTRMLP